ncbi:MAG: cytidine deaminase [Firmicutes bacterium]|nr:cytidine deaminase [Bacillota bacterium]
MAEEHLPFELTAEQRAELLRAAEQARENAYAPYSHYQVGAALLTASGRIYTGCNIENASYGATICAERVAAAKAVSAGDRDFIALAVIADSAQPGTPCGICRQFLAEFAPQLLLIMGNLQGQEEVGRLDQYLPSAFSQEYLK